MSAVNVADAGGCTVQTFTSVSIAHGSITKLGSPPRERERENMPLQKPRIFFNRGWPAGRSVGRSIARSLALANPGRDCVRVCRPLCALATAGVSQPRQSNVPGLFRLYTPLYSVSRDSITRDPQPSNGARRKSLLYIRAPSSRCECRDRVEDRKGSPRGEVCVFFFLLFSSSDEAPLSETRCC